MRRRQLLAVGGFTLGASVISTVSGQELEFEYIGERSPEQILTDTYSESGLTTGISQSGETILFGFDNGNVAIYDDDRDGKIIPLDIGRSLSHIDVLKDADIAVLGWMDADLVGLFDLTEEDGPAVEHPGMWDIDATPDAEAIASVSYPDEGPGSLGFVDGTGSIQWEIPFNNAVGYSVAIADDAEHVAVGTARYFDNGDTVGTPGIQLYDGDGDELWTHEHDEDVLSVGIDTARGLVIGGTNDGATIALDFDGNVIWETDEFGGWIMLSDDGGAVVSSGLGRTFAVDSETGEERWSVDIDIWATDDLSISDNGSRALLVDRGAGDFVLLDEGETIWSDSNDIGPGRGALAGDGNTWSTILTNLDEQAAHVAAYQIPEPEADISAVDTTLGATEVEIGESIDIEVTLENTGDADGAHTVQLLVDGEVVNEGEIEVAAGEAETITISHTFAERGEFEVAVDDIIAGTVEVIDPNIQTVVDFDWSYPDCPNEEVGELEQYFFGDLGSDGFHLDEGDGAAEVPDSCVLRTDGDEVAVTSLPNGHNDQPEPLDHYPSRGEMILIEHYAHREGTNMEFRFGVQEDAESYYAVRLETEEDPPALGLLRADAGSVTELGRSEDFVFSNGQWHDFEIEWNDGEIAVTLAQSDESTTLSVTDDTYDQGGISFYKQHTGTIRSYTHLWNNVEATN